MCATRSTCSASARVAQPTVEEIGAYIDVEPSTVADTLLANRAYRAASLDRPASQDRFGAEPRSHLIGDPGATAALDSAEQRIEAVAALGELTERERKIVIWRFYEDRTQSEIGRRLGIGQVQVSRLLRSDAPDSSVTPWATPTSNLAKMSSRADSLIAARLGRPASVGHALVDDRDVGIGVGTTIGASCETLRL